MGCPSSRFQCMHFIFLTIGVSDYWLPKKLERKLQHLFFSMQWQMIIGRYFKPLKKKSVQRKLDATMFILGGTFLPKNNRFFKALLIKKYDWRRGTGDSDFTTKEIQSSFFYMHKENNSDFDEPKKINSTTHGVICVFSLFMTLRIWLRWVKPLYQFERG